MKPNRFHSSLMRKIAYKRTGQTYTEENGFLSRTISTTSNLQGSVEEGQSGGWIIH